MCERCRALAERCADGREMCTQAVPVAYFYGVLPGTHRAGRNDSARRQPLCMAGSADGCERVRTALSRCEQHPTDAGKARQRDTGACAQQSIVARSARPTHAGFGRQLWASKHNTRMCAWPGLTRAIMRRFLTVVGGDFHYNRRSLGID
ncbi:UNVERIFIED_CONTAM: hypothetical protein Sradi_4373200 [Sesamum radiatum]|uniref:Uncharacterized protein n=1 Tax=Sesamum radiatum TaxID=300843 RepID=A0AAW2NPJ2_SESRA